MELGLRLEDRIHPGLLSCVRHSLTLVTVSTQAELLADKLARSLPDYHVRCNNA